MILIEIDIRHIFEIVETRIMIKIAEKANKRSKKQNIKRQHFLVIKSKQNVLKDLFFCLVGLSCLDLLWKISFLGLAKSLVGFIK